MPVSKHELASGRLVFAHVNYDLPENAALATKYGVTGSSLWIGVYDANGFHKAAGHSRSGP